VTGNATPDATQPNTIVSFWKINDQNGNAPAGINYGTGNHWYQPGGNIYWGGPTFRATHDYLTLLEQGNENGNPIAAMYHEGMHAWALSDNQLMGVLFRNAPGTKQAATGTDTAIHEQNFALRIPGVQAATSCQPLQEAMAFQLRQPAAKVRIQNPVLNVLAETGYLAAMKESNAIVRLARTQPGSGPANAPLPGPPAGPIWQSQPLPFSYVLRIYQPTNDVKQTWHVDLPLNPNDAAPTVGLVTALEQGIDNPPVTTATVSNNVCTVEIQKMPTLATLQVQTLTTDVPPVNGKPD
jgi:hypothetical protein